MLPAPPAATMASRERENQRILVNKKGRWLQFQKSEGLILTGSHNFKRAVVIFRKGAFGLNTLKNYDSKNYEIGEICNKGSGGNSIPGAVESQQDKENLL